MQWVRDAVCTKDAKGLWNPKVLFWGPSRKEPNMFCGMPRHWTPVSSQQLPRLTFGGWWQFRSRHLLAFWCILSRQVLHCTHAQYVCIILYYMCIPISSHGHLFSIPLVFKMHCMYSAVQCILSCCYACKLFIHFRQKYDWDYLWQVLCAGEIK